VVLADLSGRMGAEGDHYIEAADFLPDQIMDGAKDQPARALDDDGDLLALHLGELVILGV